MKSVLVLMVLSACFSGFAFGADDVRVKSASSKLLHALPSTQDLPEYSKVYDDQRDPFKDATAALTLARETNRNVLIEIGGNWCTWCHKMDAFLLKNPMVYQALHTKYVLLKINVSNSNENTAFMESLPPVLGYPHMFVSTASGKMLLSKDTAELQDNHGYSKDYWLAFLGEWDTTTSLGK